jgi:hypothetical protein
VRSLDVGALRTNAGEVIADTATATHGFSSLRQCGVNARLAINGFDDGVANRLHKAVDQRRLQIGTGSRVDAAGGNKAVFLRPKEFCFPVGAILFLLDLGQCIGNTFAYVMDVRLLAFCIFFDEHLTRYFLLLQWGVLRCCRDIGQRKLFGYWAHLGSSQKLLWSGLFVLEWRQSTISSGSVQYIDYIQCFLHWLKV